MEMSIGSCIVRFVVTATPYGQVPYLIYKGKKYGQSIAIGSFFGRKLGEFAHTYSRTLSQMSHMSVVSLPPVVAYIIAVTTLSPK